MYHNPCVFRANVNLVPTARHCVLLPRTRNWHTNNGRRMRDSFPLASRSGIRVAAFARRVAGGRSTRGHSKVSYAGGWHAQRERTREAHTAERRCMTCGELGRCTFKCCPPCTRPAAANASSVPAAAEARRRLARRRLRRPRRRARFMARRTRFLRARDAWLADRHAPLATTTAQPATKLGMRPARGER